MNGNNYVDLAMRTNDGRSIVRLRNAVMNGMSLSIATQ